MHARHGLQPCKILYLYMPSPLCDYRVRCGWLCILFFCRGCCCCCYCYYFAHWKNVIYISLYISHHFFWLLVNTQTNKKIHHSFIHSCSGYMGASLCMILSSWGSAWGTWRAGLGICHMGVDHPAGIIKNIVPVVMAGVLGIYGLIVAVIITQAVVPPSAGFGNTYSAYNGYTHVRFVCVFLLLLFAIFCIFCMDYFLSITHNN